MHVEASSIEAREVSRWDTDLLLKALHLALQLADLRACLRALRADGGQLRTHAQQLSCTAASSAACTVLICQLPALHSRNACASFQQGGAGGEDSWALTSSSLHCSLRCSASLSAPASAAEAVAAAACVHMDIIGPALQHALAQYRRTILAAQRGMHCCIMHACLSFQH
jgi:hypothetical protein